jgi:MFS family permease
MLQPLRERDFALLWAGMTVSLLGDGIYFVALAWQAYDLSNRPSALGVVGMAFTGGMVLFLLAGGVLSDRVPRRNVMMGADLGRAAVLAAIGALSLHGSLQLWMLAVLVFVYGAGDAFFGPAFGALVPEIVPAPMLVQANAVQQTVRNLASKVVGPAAGGLAVALLGAGGAFLLDAATFVVSLPCIAAMRVRETPGDTGASGLQDVREGLAYVRSHTWLWATLLATALSLLVFFGPSEVLVPYVIRNDLGGGAGAFGAFLGSLGLGWVAGSAWMGSRSLPRRPVTVLYVWWGVGSLPLCLFGIATHTWQLMVLGFVAGVPTAIGLIVWEALIQTRVPRALLGRVTSVDWFVSIGLTPLSFALTAPVAGAIGIDATFIAAGLLGGVVSIGLLYLVPGLRERGEVGAEARVGDGVRLHADDLDPLAAREAGDGADHGEPVVAQRVDRPAP